MKEEIVKFINDKVVRHASRSFEKKKTVSMLELV